MTSLNYFQSEVRKTIDNVFSYSPTASGGISLERFKRGSPNFTHSSWTSGPTNRPDMTSLAASNRLQNTIKYCTEVHKIGAACNELNNLVPVWRTITSNDALNVCETLKLSGAAFCLASPIVGFLVALYHNLHPPSFVVVRSFVVHHEVSSLNISRMNWLRITQFCMCIHTTLQPHRIRRH